MNIVIYKSKKIIPLLVVFLILFLVANVVGDYLLTYHEEKITRIARLTFLLKVSQVALVIIFIRLIYELFNRNKPVIIFGKNSIEINAILRRKTINWDDIVSASVIKGKIADQIIFRLKKKGLSSTYRVCVKEVFIISAAIRTIKEKGILINL